jgi:hypothetical protein
MKDPRTGFDRGARRRAVRAARRCPGRRERLLHSFPGGRPYGTMPLRALTLDAAGNLYGTTRYGGASDAGTVSEVTR